MVPVHGTQIDITHNIHIVNQERIIPEKPGGLCNSSTGIEQFLLFMRKIDFDPKHIFRLHKIYDHLRIMMHIDNNRGKSLRFQLQNTMLQKSTPLPFQKCLGLVIGERLQTGPQSGRKDHCFIFLGLQHHFSLGDSLSHLAQTYFIFLLPNFSSSLSVSLQSLLLINSLYAENNRYNQ